MTYIKICGITNISDAEHAIKCGVSALGFIAFPPSPRHINSDKFAELAIQIKKINSEIELVVVMVNPTTEFISSYTEAGADIIQFHGKEPIEFVNAYAGRCWKAFNIQNREQIEQIKNYKVEKYLIDSFVKGEKVPGGSGVKADWQLSKLAVNALNKPVILAGGINPENIIEAIEIVRPYGIDLSSGVEISPGVKSHQKITDLFNSLNG